MASVTLAVQGFEENDMRDDRLETPSVVVGIDGSRAALTAALWAVDEAVDRDIPLRLVYAIEPVDRVSTQEEEPRKLATAEIAVRHAMTVVESANKTVKLEIEIMRHHPARALLHSASSAAMICVGARGLRTAEPGRVGSTATELATSAHCPIAIIRGYDPSASDTGAVVVEVDSSPERDAVLQRAIAEAVLRRAELRVVSAWQWQSRDIHDSFAVAERDRQVRADLDRRMARWKRTHPDLSVQTIAIQGNFVDYLVRQATTIQLVVVARRRTHGLTEVVGAPGCAVLKDTNCSVLVCDPHGAL